MASIINTKNINQVLNDLHGEQVQQIYNSLDCLVTREVADNLLPKIKEDPHARAVATFEQSLQAPIMEIMQRGILVDIALRQEMIEELERQRDRIQWIINQYAQAIHDKDFNPNSTPQFKEIFYTKLGIKPIWKNEKGERKIDTSREALEKLLLHWRAEPLARACLKFRDINKTLGTLKSGVDSDNRIRAMYNPAGTDTGRWSSSKNPCKTGTNLQNIDPQLRHIFVADPGYKMAYIDLEQAEARAVAYMATQVSGETNYLEACESGDVHTMVARMVWPELDWTGDLKHDKAVAEQPFYRHFIYRFMAKTGQHGTNYYGSPFTMARHLKVPKRIMEDFQERYFDTFPEIPKWHKATARELQTVGILVTPLGRKRQFFDRKNSDDTLRKAIAFKPQSLVGDILNIGLYRLWWYLPEVELLAQTHDAVLVQYPEAREDELLPQAMDLVQTPIQIGDHVMKIPVEAETGWNWGEKKRNPETNPDGLIEWDGNDARNRIRQPSASLLDAKLS